MASIEQDSAGTSRSLLAMP
ncbi:unnamed protein product, partial [Rotaria sp. Silwood2]